MTPATSWRVSAAAAGEPVHGGPAARVVVRGMWLALHRDLRHVARVRALSDFLVETVRRERALLMGREVPPEED